MIRHTSIDFIHNSGVSQELIGLADKAIKGERITVEEGILLFEKGELGFLGTIANLIREKKHGNHTFFNRNIHIEPTNICVFDCKFCSYSKLLREKTQGWELTEDEIYDIVRSYKDKAITEIHIVGGVHPKMGLHYFGNLIKNIKKIRPDIHVKAFTAV
jgi:aminodeoxyfutalosine synthase